MMDRSGLSVGKARISQERPSELDPNVNIREQKDGWVYGWVSRWDRSWENRLHTIYTYKHKTTYLLCLASLSYLGWNSELCT